MPRSAYRRFAVAAAAALAAACASTDSMAEGDRHFRLGEFVQAAAAYEAAGAADGGGRDLDQRLTEARYRSFTALAEQMLHLDQPAEALRILDLAEPMRAGHPVGTALRQRAHRQLAVEYTALGDAHSIDGDAKPAAEAYAEALSWDSDYEPAQEGLARSQDLLNRQFRAGERYYFRGLEALNQANDVRAFTALTHAATYWGGDSRAGEHLAEVAARLAQQSVETAQVYLDAGMAGPAWLALRNAERLQPGRADVQSLLPQVEADLAVGRALGAADMAVRSGDIDRADAKLAEAAALGGERHADAIDVLAQRNQAERLAQKYLVAYAAELDHQSVAARDLYFEILEQGGGADVAERYRMQKALVERAEQAYQAALAAEAAGDPTGYEAKLGECLRLARDYGDALERFTALQRAKLAPPAQD